MNQNKKEIRTQSDNLFSCSEDLSLPTYELAKERNLRNLLLSFVYILNYQRKNKMLDKLKEVWGKVKENFLQEENDLFKCMVTRDELEHKKEEQIFEAIKKHILKFTTEDIVSEIIEIEVDRFNDIYSGTHQWNVESLKNLINKIIRRLTLLQSYGILPERNEMLENLKSMASSRDEELLRKNYFLSYILEIQSKISRSDLINVLNNGRSEKSENLPESMKRMMNEKYLSEAIDQFFRQNELELQEKFKSFEMTDGSKLANVCDYLLILRLFLQDQTSLQVHLKEEESQGVSIFRSLKASDIITKSVYKFFYEDLKINPLIPGNSKFELRMNLTFFKRITKYLFRNEIITIRKREETDASAAQFPAVKDKGFRELDWQEEAPAGKFSEIDYSLGFKLTTILNDLRISQENSFSALEKEICGTLISTICKEVRKLKFYASTFAHKTEPREIIAEKTFEFKRIYNHFINEKRGPGPHSMSFHDFQNLLVKLKIQSYIPQLTTRNLELIYINKLVGNNNVYFPEFLQIIQDLIDRISRFGAESDEQYIIGEILKRFDSYEVREKRESKLKARESMEMTPNVSGEFGNNRRNLLKPIDKFYELRKETPNRPSSKITAKKPSLDIRSTLNQIQAGGIHNPRERSGIRIKINNYPEFERPGPDGNRMLPKKKFTVHANLKK